MVNYKQISTRTLRVLKDANQNEVIKLDIGERKKKILEAIIKVYTVTGEPVGSKAISEHLSLSVSSATIRNEMAELVELGFLEQPHTSAGRVPTQQTYRYYIDQLMTEIDVDPEIKRYMDSMLSSLSDDPDRLLAEAPHLLAQVTRYAAAATTPASQKATIKSIQIMPTGRRTALIILITSAGILKNKLFRCDFDLTPELLRVISRLLAEHITGVPLASITPVFIQSLATSFLDLVLLISPVLMAVYEAAREVAEAEVRLGGQFNLLSFPEFGGANAKELFAFLEQREELAKLLFTGYKGVRVLMGSELNRPELKDLSIVTAHYTLNGVDRGAIAVIGPHRMDYPTIVANLGYLASAIGKLMSEMLGDAE